MRYANKMVLVPEDMYRSTLLATHKRVPESRAPNSSNFIASESAQEPEISATAQSLARVKREANISADARQILYMQQARFLQKLLNDRDSKAVPVEMGDETVAKMAAALSANPTSNSPNSSTTKNSKKQQNLTASAAKQDFKREKNDIEAALSPHYTPTSPILPAASVKTGGDDLLTFSATPNISKGQRLGTQVASSSLSTFENEEETDEVALLDELMAYCQKNRKELALNGDDQVVALGQTRPIRGSNLRNILAYALQNTSQKKGKAPPGYAVLASRFAQDSFLSQRLSLPSSTKKAKTTRSTYKSPPKKSPPLSVPLQEDKPKDTPSTGNYWGAFKPQLW